MLRRGRGGGGGGFVSASASGGALGGGAAIPPPPDLVSTMRKPMTFPAAASVTAATQYEQWKAAGGGGNTGAYNAAPPPQSLAGSHNYASRGPPGPPVPGVSKHGYSTITSIHSNAMSHYGDEVLVKRSRTEEEYFNDNDEEEPAKAKEEEALPYQPAPGSPGPQPQQPEAEESDEEEDPLDAYMADLEKDAKKQGLKSVKQPVSSAASVGAPAPQPLSAAAKKCKPDPATAKGVRVDIDDEDDEESYYKWMEENPNAGKTLDEDDLEIEYDEDGNPIAPPKSKYIDPLPPIDHSQIEYKPFDKNFYNEHVDIAGLSPIQVIDLRQKLDIHVSGAAAPKLVTSFAHFGFDDELIKAIRKSEFTTPTPIQAQGIPAVMAGRDVIGIAKTGSGKTAAFLWPMLVHIMDQPRLKRGEGPIGLILVPTRELALQIYTEAKKFGKIYGIQSVCAYGGGSKWEQSKGFEAGAEIAIATPGRMIDMIKMKVTNLERVTYLVLDEADRMFDMGFEPQVRSICDHARPDRQCSLFSATFKKRIERLARDALRDPVKIVQGSVGEASEDVTQIVKVMQVGGVKWNWIVSHLVEFTSAGSVLIFVTKKLNCTELANNLLLKEFECRCIHGDLMQHERNEIIHKFKKQEFAILVATDVAARGLDIPHVRTVVNFDVARDIDTHTHRVGRTGRAGVKGTAYTLVTEKDKEFVGHIVRNLEAANQDVPKDLLDLANKSSWFKNSRFKKTRGKNVGLGFKDRGGFGSGGGGGGDGDDSGNANLTPLGAPPAAAAAALTYSPSPPDSAPSGPAGGGRLTAVRTAFKSSFMSNFRAAVSAEAGANCNSAPRAGFIAPPAAEQRRQQQDTTEDRKRKDSRWK